MHCTLQTLLSLKCSSYTQSKSLNLWWKNGRIQHFPQGCHPCNGWLCFGDPFATVNLRSPLCLTGAQSLIPVPWEYGDQWFPPLHMALGCHLRWRLSKVSLFQKFHLHTEPHYAELDGAVPTGPTCAHRAPAYSWVTRCSWQQTWFFPSLSHAVKFVYLILNPGHTHAHNVAASHISRRQIMKEIFLPVGLWRFSFCTSEPLLAQLDSFQQELAFA